MYTLPKIWMGRIQKYWDKTMPSDFPISSSVFSFKFETEEIRETVVEMEESIGTEDCPVNEFVPEGTIISGYSGTYDVSAEPGLFTLLSPEPAQSDNVIAMHYNVETEAWEQIEDAKVVNGYVWGTLESFSPVAIFTYRKDIHLETDIGISTISYANYLVCEGNIVKIYLDDEGKTIASSESTGTKIELTQKTLVIGGSADGSAIRKTNLAFVGLKNNAIVNKVIGGSIFVGDDFTTVDEVNVSGFDTVIGCLTGSYGAVRTMKVNFNLNNVLLAWLGCGEGYANIGTINPTFASRCWAKEVNMNLINVKCGLTFLGQNCEYFYVDSTKGYVEGGEHEYLIMGGSNDGTKDSVIEVKDAKVGIFQTTNRGNVANCKAKFYGNNEVENLFVGGDATDSTVTGTTGKLRYDITGPGTYNIVNGTEAGTLLTADVAKDIVDVIKVSRSSNITIDNSLKDILGDKYLVM